MNNTVGLRGASLAVALERALAKLGITRITPHSLAYRLPGEKKPVSLNLAVVKALRLPRVN